MDETGGGDSGGGAGAVETAANDNVAPPEAANDNVGARGPSDVRAANTDAGGPSTASPEAPAESGGASQPERGAGAPPDIGAGGPRESTAITEQPARDGSPSREAANDNPPPTEQAPGGGQAVDAAGSTVETKHGSGDAGSSDAQPRDNAPVESANLEAPPSELPSAHDAETSPDSAVDVPADAAAAPEAHDIAEDSDVARESPGRMADVTGDAAGDETGQRDGGRDDGGRPDAELSSDADYVSNGRSDDAPASSTELQHSKATAGAAIAGATVGEDVGDATGNDDSDTANNEPEQVQAPPLELSVEEQDRTDAASPESEEAAERASLDRGEAHDVGAEGPTEMVDADADAPDVGESPEGVEGGEAAEPDALEQAGEAEELGEDSDDDDAVGARESRADRELPEGLRPADAQLAPADVPPSPAEQAPADEPVAAASAPGAAGPADGSGGPPSNTEPGDQPTPKFSSPELTAAWARGYDTPSGRAYFSDSDSDKILRDGSTRMPALKGEYTAATHGASTHVKMGSDRFAASELAELIRADPKWDGQPVRLFSCNTGQGESPFAQKLADELGVPVTAPDTPAWLRRNGDHFLASKRDVELENGMVIRSVPTDPPDGKWHTFQPRRR